MVAISLAKDTSFPISSYPHVEIDHFTANKLSTWILEGSSWLSLSFLFTLLALSSLVCPAVLRCLKPKPFSPHYWDCYAEVQSVQNFAAHSMSSLTIKPGGFKNDQHKNLDILLVTHALHSTVRALPSRSSYWRGGCGAEWHHPVDARCGQRDGSPNSTSDCSALDFEGQGKF